MHRLMQSLPDIAAASAARTRRSAILARQQEFRPKPSATSSRAGAGRARRSALRARCSRPAAAPRCRSSGRARRPGRCPARSTASWSRRCGADRRLQDQSPGAAQPRRSAGAHAAYVTQLALYRAVLAQLYPDRPVRAALVWTDVPDLMEIPAAALDAALAAPHLRVRRLDAPAARSYVPGSPDAPFPDSKRGAPWPLAKFPMRLSKPKC